MLVDFKLLSDSSKLWVFQSDKIIIVKSRCYRTRGDLFYSSSQHQLMVGYERLIVPIELFSSHEKAEVCHVED